MKKKNKRPSKMDRKLARPDTPKRARITTFKPNGSPPETADVPTEVPIEQAIAQAVEELGDIVIDDTLAPQQLRELAECHADVVRSQAEYNRKRDAASVAKKSLESITNLLLEKVRTFTHPTPLPLFDAPQAEADLAAMIEDATSDGDEPADATSGA